MRRTRTTLTMLALVALMAQPVLAQEMPGSAQGAGSAEQDARYERATTALDEGRYEQAIELYRQLVEERSARQDAALYWMAYAQQRRGDLPAALRSLARLRSGFPESAWQDDARYLEAEIREQGGQRLDPDEADDQEMRLHALNALMRVDSERALPVLERILRGDESREMKERALFILLHGGEPAFDLLADIARNEADNDLRMPAIQQLGLTGDERAFGLLEEIYASTGDHEIKQAVLHGFAMAGDRDRLLRIARQEDEIELRVAAIHGLSTSGGAQEIWTLYESESSTEVREAILLSMAMSGGTDRLMQVVRNETDPDLRRTAIEALIVSGDHEDEEKNTRIRELMLEIYESGADLEIRRAAMQFFWMHEDATSLIELFEREQDRDMKRQIVEALSMMDSPEAVDFLLRLIEQ